MARSQTVQVDIKGLKRALHTMDGLPKRTKKNIIGQAMKRASKPMVKSAKSKAPRRTGRLRRSIASWKKKTKNPELFVVKVGPRQSGKWAGYHGHLVEFGTDKMEAQPYLEPAYREHRKRYVADFRDETLSEIIKKASKMLREGKIKR